MGALQQTTLPSSAEQMAGLVKKVRRVICEETSTIFSEQYGTRMCTLVLTGSISRGEPALLVNEQNTNVLVLGDADFLAIFEEQSELPAPSEVQALCARAEAAASRRGVQCKIGMGVVDPQFLRNSKPSIFSYELRTCGNVVYGDPATLALIPNIALSDIPLQDAWCTLCNRMIELLEVSYSESAKTPLIPLKIQYRLVKLWLDMATSFLVFAGAYAPTYKERAKRLRRLAESGSSQEPWPFSLSEFSSTVTSATEWRVSSVNVSTRFSSWDGWRDAVQHARALWRWELCGLTGSAPDASDRQLWETWMRTGSTRLNVRGWLHVIRKRGCRSWRNWPHWVSLGLRASPRCWIYGAAGELLFQVQADVTGDPQGGVPKECDHVYKWLLETPATDSIAVKTWRTLAADVAWNYNEFLVDTRS